MTEWLLSLVPTYGLWLVALVTFGSCIALPIPASVIMLAAGGFAASGDLVLWQLILFGVTGAVLGDHCGYGAGRLWGSVLVARLERRRSRQRLISRARRAMEERGGIAIFLSRWLFSPLGPYVNILAGSMRNSWAPFAIYGLCGETIWVTVYILMGNAFAGNLAAASDMIASGLSLIAAASVMLGIGLWLWHPRRRAKRRDKRHARRAEKAMLKGQE